MGVEPIGYGEPGVQPTTGHVIHPLRRVGPEHLMRSKDLGDKWEMSEGPDIRGWDLVDHNGDSIGKIDDVVVDTATGEALFAIVRVGTPLSGGKVTLIPMDLLDIVQLNKKVVSPLSAESLKAAPQFEDKTVDLNPFYDFWERWTGPTGVAGTPGVTPRPEALREPKEQTNLRFHEKH